MKQTVSKSDFRDAFEAIRPKNFTYDGLEALFNYLEEIDRESQAEMEFDVIAICCEFMEYKNLAEYNENYSDYPAESIADIEKHTTVISIPSRFCLTTNMQTNGDGFIIQQY